MSLLDGEEIIFTHLGNSSEVATGDDAINEKYSKGEIRIITEQARYPLSSILGMLTSDNYKLNPEFQRRHRWNNEQKSRLIESFIMNVPIPPIFLYEDSYSHYEVMDGLQRLTAIKEFYSDIFQLEGLEEWPELNGKKYSNLPIQVKKGIDRRYLSSIILLQETAKDPVEAMKLKQLVFERINSGGVKLEPQESRNAVYNGPFNNLCIKLARDKYLCKMFGIPEVDSGERDRGEISEDLVQNPLYRNMGDVELVLRFFANRQRDSLIKNTKSLREYLDLYLKYANLLTEDALLKMSQLFTETMEFTYELLGEQAFHLYRERSGNWSWYDRPTTAIFDPLTKILSELLEQKTLLISKKAILKTTLESFYKTNYNDFEGRNTNPGVIITREELLRDLFNGLLK